MGISRDSRHKRRKTGGRMPIHQKKRKFERGRQPAGTKLGENKKVEVKCRGNVMKRRALRINEGNFCWISEGVSRKCKIISVAYNATNNELVRTQRIVQGCVVVIDPTPFKYYWTLHWEDSRITRMPESDKTDKTKKEHLEQKKAKHFQEWKEGKETENEKAIREAQEKRHRGVKEETKRSDNKHPFNEHLEKLHHFFELMNKGRIYAKLTSRPGQCGRADGYLLEGKELEFYTKKLDKK